MDIDSITAICEAESNKIDPVTEDEVRKALSKLKNNKAADTMGLCSERLKLGVRVHNIILELSDQF